MRKNLCFLIGISLWISLLEVKAQKGFGILKGNDLDQALIDKTLGNIQFCACKYLCEYHYEGCNAFVFKDINDTTKCFLSRSYCNILTVVQDPNSNIFCRSVCPDQVAAGNNASSTLTSGAFYYEGSSENVLCNDGYQTNLGLTEQIIKCVNGTWTAHQGCELTVAPPLSCTPPFQLHGSNCLYVDVSSAGSWESAKANCRTYPNGDLAMPKTPAEMAHITALVGGYPNQYFLIGAWIGANDTLYWNDMEEVVFAEDLSWGFNTEINTQEPTLWSSEKCIYTSAYLTGGTLGDYLCNGTNIHPMDFICQEF